MALCPNPTSGTFCELVQAGSWGEKNRISNRLSSVDPGGKEGMARARERRVKNRNGTCVPKMVKETIVRIKGNGRVCPKSVQP